MTTNLVLNNCVIPSLSGVFAPVSQSSVEGLLAEFDATKNNIERVNAEISEFSTMRGLRFLLRAGAYDPHKAHIDPSRLSGFGDKERAIQILTSDYWDKALNLTDIMQFMPAEKREAWREDIDQLNTPEFTKDTVYETLRQLLIERENYLAERVDGIFQRLSGEHVTNRPEGFYKRMIFNAEDAWQSGFSRLSMETVHDLRFVISLFMGREYNQNHIATDRLIEHLHSFSTGEWIDLDGGSLRIKVFKKRTIHAEVHPDIAWRLNEILALLHPKAIPSEFRKQKSRKRSAVWRESVLMQELIPQEVLTALADMRPAHERRGLSYVRIPNAVQVSCSMSKHLTDAVKRVLRACGGTPLKRESSNVYQFSYDWYTDIRMHIVSTGQIPDSVSHQYYPTPDKVAKELVSHLDIKDQDLVLEPSAGQGALAEAIDKPHQLCCIEVSELHCDILRSKEVASEVINEDFLLWSESSSRLFDKIIMNPPFTDGRSVAHASAALKHLKRGGALVALVSKGAASKLEEEFGFTVIDEVSRKDFPGVAVDLRLVKCAA